MTVARGLPAHRKASGIVGSRGPSCPGCGHEVSQVLDHRMGKRRRACARCEKRFFTREALVQDASPDTIEAIRSDIAAAMAVLERTLLRIKEANK